MNHKERFFATINHQPVDIPAARRSGDEWFIGSVTNTEVHKLKLPLNFLEKNRKYEATVYSDDPATNTRTHVRIHKMTVSSETILNLDLNTSGGQAIHIIPKL